MSAPLLPRATAIWLVENTALTFRQIATFCQLHEMEVEGIADGEVGQGIKGMDPIATGQLTRDEIARCSADDKADLQLAGNKYDVPKLERIAGRRYTPVSRRRDRPDAILWLLRNHPELSDGQIGRLVGTTSTTIKRVKDRTHWNMPNIKPMDPVSLGLCKQDELDTQLAKAARKAARKQGGKPESEASKAAPEGARLVAAEAPAPKPAEEKAGDEKSYDPDAVFAPLKEKSGGGE